MHAERDHLVRFVFPKLRADLLARGIHLVDVDLRWGVTSDQDTFEVCRDVIDECRPRFLCMLGGRYGWVPPGKTNSITADEVRHGVLEDAPAQRAFALFYFRDPATTAAMVETDAGEFREPEGSAGQKALQQLKSAIVSAGLQPVIYQARWDNDAKRLIDLTAFGDWVYADLKRTIDDEFGPYAAEPLEEFAEENAAMAAFMEERTKRFVLGSREPLRDALLAYATSSGGESFLCLVGEPGSGKSALLAHVGRHPGPRSRPSILLISHFVGASTGSTDVRRTLRRLCHELAAGTGISADIPDDPEKLRTVFSEILEQASMQKRVVILLDAVNQFDPTPQFSGLSWLPEELPRNARLILSALPGPSLDELRSRRDLPREVTVPALTLADGEAIIKEFLHRYRKTMTLAQRNALLAKTDASTPLYLSAALEELRTLGSYEEITDRIAQLPSDTQALFTWIFKRLEDDDGFRGVAGRKIGPALVPRLASLIGVSRHGLSERELTDLLDEAQGNVAALLQLLRPYLMRRGELLDFYHAQLRAAVKSAYLTTIDARSATHRALAEYFEGVWHNHDRHALRELPYHQAHGGMWTNLEGTLCDLQFIQAKCAAGMTHDLLADYAIAAEVLPEARTDVARARQLQAQMEQYFRDLSVRTKKVQAAVERRLIAPESRSRPVLDDCAPVVPPRSVNPRSARETSATSPSAPSSGRTDRLRAFEAFVGGNAHKLVSHSSTDDYCVQEAYNWAGSGPVADAAERFVSNPGMNSLLLLRPSAERSFFAGVQNPVRRLSGHVNVIRSVAMSGDGLRAASVDGEACRIWDVATGRCTAVYRGEVLDQTDELNIVTLRPDGRRMVTVSRRGVVQLWNLETGDCRQVLGADAEGDSSSWAIAPDCAIAVSSHTEGVLRRWHLELGCSFGEVHIGDGSLDICAFALTAEGLAGISGSRDGSIRLWDMWDGRCLQRMEGHIGAVTQVAITVDGTKALTAGDDKTVRAWDLNTGHCVSVLHGHTEAVLDVALTPDGRLGISGSRDKSLRVWDLMSGECLAVLAGHPTPVSSVALSADGRRAISCGSWEIDTETFQGLAVYTDHVRDHDVYIWDVQNAGDGQDLPLKTDQVNVVLVTPDGERAVSGGGQFDGQRDFALRVWDSVSGRLLHSREGHEGEITALAVTPDSSHVVSASLDQTIRVWELEGLICRRVVKGHTAQIKSVDITADGQRLVSGSYDGSVRVWDFATGTELHAFPGDTAVVSPDGRTVVCEDGVWDLVEGRLLVPFSKKQTGIEIKVLSPDGRLAVAVQRHRSQHVPHSLVVWDLVSGASVMELGGHQNRPFDVIFAPDGRLLISREGHGNSFTAGQLRLWDFRNGTCALVSDKLGDLNVEVTSDGKHAVSTSLHKAVNLWNLETRELLAVWALDRDAPAVSVRGKLISVGDRTGNVLFRRLHRQSEAHAVCTATRAFRHDSRQWADVLTFMCPHCSRSQVAGSGVLDVIHRIDTGLSSSQAPCLGLPNEAWDEPRLQAECQHCQRALMFNPFIVDSRASYFRS